MLNNKTQKCAIAFLARYFNLFVGFLRVSFLSYADSKTAVSKKSKVYPFCKITNSNISDYTYISYGGSINNTRIGKFCSIGRSFKSGMGKHPIDFFSTSPIFYSKNNALGFSLARDCVFKEYSEVSIGNDVWIGAEVMILDGVQIGDGAIVAAKSLVNKDVPPYAIVGGVPAKIIRYRFDPNTIEKLLELKWWDFSIEKLSSIPKECLSVKEFLLNFEKE